MARIRAKVRVSLEVEAGSAAEAIPVARAVVEEAGLVEAVESLGRPVNVSYSIELPERPPKRVGRLSQPGP